MVGGLTMGVYRSFYWHPDFVNRQDGCFQFEHHVPAGFQNLDAGKAPSISGHHVPSDFGLLDRDEIV